MSDLKETADRYLAVWNEPNASKRQEAIAALFTADATYTDPMVEVQGQEQIAAVVAGAREQFPGFVFSLIGETDAHHNIARFHWGLGPDGAEEPLVIGFDVVVADGAGRLASVAGFLDKVPGA